MSKRQPLMSSTGEGAKCHYCDIRCTKTNGKKPFSATRDHIIPKSCGGEVRVWCCRACNHIKDNMTPDQWLSFRLTYPQYKDFYQEPWLPEFRAKFIKAFEKEHYKFDLVF